MIAKAPQRCFTVLLVLTSYGTTQSMSAIKEPSKMKQYLVSINQVVPRTSAAEICWSRGGHLINLECPQTEEFLRHLEEPLTSRGIRSKRFFTGLRLVDDLFIWDDDCTLASDSMVEYATGDRSDYNPAKLDKFFQLYFNRDDDRKQEGDFLGRWCPSECTRNYICAIATADPCDFHPLNDVTVSGLTKLTRILNMDQCRQTCLDTVLEEGECWFFGVEGDACYMWLSDKQPNEKLVVMEKEDAFVVYSKKCVAVLVADQFSRGTNRIPEEDELCNYHGVLEADPAVHPAVRFLEPSSTFILSALKSTVSTQIATEATERDMWDDSVLDNEISVPVTADPSFIIATQTFQDLTMWSTYVINDTSFKTADDELPFWANSLPTEPRSADSCVYVCRTVNNQTEEEKEQFTAELVANLTIDVKKTSANVRKYKCAEDPRPSATKIGGFGAVILGLVFGGLVSTDLPAFIKFIYNLVKRLRAVTGGCNSCTEGRYSANRSVTCNATA